MKELDVLVIGAGMGGMASAALWAKRNFKVEVIESHYSTGGCAGYYKRREGLYDVGATTLSGLERGRPTQRLFQELDLKLELYPCDPGIVSHFNGLSFSFYKNREKLKQEIYRVFKIKIDKEIDDWTSIESKLWESLNVARPIEMITLADIYAFLTSSGNSLLLRPQLFLKSFYDFLPKRCRENKQFIQFIDQLLMISTQQTSSTCPAFIGILGFLYPRDTYAVKGGMYGLCKALEEKIKELGADISVNNACTEIIKEDDHFIVYSKKEKYKTKKIICNISPEIFNSLYKNGPMIKQDHQETWGAMTAYFAVKSQFPINTLYHQVHCQEGSYFYSLSHSDDQVKSKNFQMVTVSTHINKKLFTKRDERYETMKNEFKEKVIREFKETFKNKNIEEIIFDSVATPLTFKYFTGRPKGEVGGLIHHSALSLTRLLSNKLSSQKGIYYTGDYSFPGQGIVSVFQSAFNTLD